jgi:hypothetical protein
MEGKEGRGREGEGGEGKGWLNPQNLYAAYAHVTTSILRNEIIQINCIAVRCNH